MQNRPIFKKFQEATKDWTLAQLEALTYQKMIKDFGLTPKEVEEIGPYHSGIRKHLIRDLEAIQEEQAKVEMVDKLLLSGSNLTPEEARIAVEKIFEERKNGLRST